MEILVKILLFIILGFAFFLFLYIVGAEMTHKQDWLDSHKKKDEEE